MHVDLSICTTITVLYEGLNAVCPEGSIGPPLVSHRPKEERETQNTGFHGKLNVGEKA